MSDNKRKGVALVSAFFFHIIFTSVFFIIKFSYAADKERQGFSDVIFFNSISSIEIMDEKKILKKVEEKNQEKYIEESEDMLNAEPQLEDRVNKLFDNLLNPTENNINEDSVPIEGYLDQNASNSESEATLDTELLEYDVEKGGVPNEIQGRKKLRGGKLVWGGCESVAFAIKYKLKVTVKKDGQVEVINCIDMSGVGNRCLKDAAESAANSILFEKDQSTSDLDKIGDTFYLLYTFSPTTK